MRGPCKRSDIGWRNTIGQRKAIATGTFRPESLASLAAQMALLLPKCQSVKFPFFYHTLLCHILQPLIENGRGTNGKGNQGCASAH